ncbi:uncharacterized protein (DUF1330 family) [Herbaspirillum sp. Sphag1AN]|uniref:DUF1330 domain-containing protein n=1 Tax=unclassified Herbaspirillum TaxID=2624150 RepID=UPI00161A451F|nr:MULTISPECIES: DUF1330 domain-containing protein [unclassified Herbaspirillum]MBB3211812.1 uncharacterized protein (DUF1330 family) [Herbaspirillum sp. Sphag1AN]MBB3244354.1 uncharacterized protein (DUF1330 family) [Herbaspirillum sp. Sphag64]
MSKGYWVSAYQSVSDPDTLKAYAKLAEQAVTTNGGRFIVRTAEAIEAHEAGKVQRIVVVEFASFEQAKKAYASQAYQEALAVLGSSAVRDFRIVEGVPS